MSEKRDTVRDTLQSEDVVIPEGMGTIEEFKKFIRKAKEEGRKKTRELLALEMKNIQGVNKSQD